MLPDRTLIASLALSVEIPSLLPPPRSFPTSCSGSWAQKNAFPFSSCPWIRIFSLVYPNCGSLPVMRSLQPQLLFCIRVCSTVSPRRLTLMSHSLQNQGSSFGGQGGRDFHSFPVRGVVPGLSGCLFVPLTFNEVFTSHTSDLRTETETLTCFLLPKHQQKWELSLDPWQWELAGKWHGTVPHSQWSFWMGSTSLKELQTCSPSHLEMLGRNFHRCLNLSVALNPLAGLSWCPSREFCSTFGNSQAGSGSLSQCFRMCHTHCWPGLWDLAWCPIPSTMGLALEKCYFRQTWNYFVSRAVPSPRWCLPCSHSVGCFYLVITGFQQ